MPTITRPTRITSESATLNDNIYVTGNRLEYIRSGILVAYISDHFPIFVFTGKKLNIVNLKTTPIPIENWTIQPLIESTPFC